MPHVSKHKPMQQLLDRITDELIRTLLKLRYRNSDIKFLLEFFTKTEQVMFAKRLAIAALLLKKMPPYHIQRALKVSPSTIALLKLKLEKKQLRRIEEVLTRYPVSFWHDVLDLFKEGFSRNTKRRSKWMKDNLPPS